MQPFNDIYLNKINAQQAWDITKGSRSISIAITDPRGFFFGHPDYVNSSSASQILFADPSALNELYSFSSGNDHGLRVASMAAMATDNGIGVSPLGFNSGLMAFPGTIQKMLEASYDFGANIVEASWTNSCVYNTSHQMIIDMIHDNGTVVIVAAGNGNAGSSCNPDGHGNGLTYPAAYNHVICVSGTNLADEYNNGSLHFTFNESVDVTAPGWAVPTASVTFTVDGNGVRSFGGYSYLPGNGTSFAAPIVAGLAALILSINPNLPPDGVEYIIKSTATNVDNIPGNEVYAGYAGSGRIDAHQAVKYARDCFACVGSLQLPFLGSILPSSVSASCRLEVGVSTLQSGSTISYSANKDIILKPGFTASAGSNAHFRISDYCSILTEPSTSSARVGNKINHVRYRDLIERGEIEISEDDLYLENEASVVSYPNPASEQIIFSFDLDEPSLVRIEIADFSGRLVGIPVNEHHDTGAYEYVYDISSLEPGLYFYKLISDQGLQTRRLVIVR